jgi:hypothetical protein
MRQGADMTDKENVTANDAIAVTRTDVKHVAGSGRSTTIRRCAFTPRCDCPHPFARGSRGDRGKQALLPLESSCPHSGLS